MHENVCLDQGRVQQTGEEKQELGKETKKKKKGEMWIQTEDAEDMLRESVFKCFGLKKPTRQKMTSNVFTKHRLEDGDDAVRLRHGK